MKLITRIIILTSLLLPPGCSSVTKTGEKRVTRDNSNHTAHQHKSSSGHQEHMGHDSNGKSTNQAKITVPKNLVANQPVNLVIYIQDTKGKSINKFDTFQEKLMHLIIVRDDLTSFEHLHPNYKGNGRFEISAKFSSPGDYSLFSDYKPSGQPEAVSIMQVKIPGTIPLPKNLEMFETTKVLSNAKVNFKLPTKNIQTGKEVTLKFDIQDTVNNQPIKDLLPYLGERGHLVIIKSSSPLTVADYIHAHALKKSPDGQIEFLTRFPQPGTYKLWIQFNRNGKINTADFWVNVV
jgi:antitoxin component YwqK of YwqJK toxin-antitoxin module